MREIGERIERNVEEIKGHVVDVVQRHVIAGTPLSPADSGHSGRARNNWFVSVGEPVAMADYVGPFDPSGRLRMDTNTAVALSNPGVQVKFFLTNNLDYIGKLNAGSSQQAPANFVRLAVLEGVSEIKEARVLE